ncbi:hypothetical protein DZB54_01355 [Herbaspirillum sp. 3R-3a1]|nr:hypothetical protein DZB54_01355 [Herbaspirillum sp. 3R-3a1]
MILLMLMNGPAGSSPATVAILSLIDGNGSRTLPKAWPEMGRGIFKTYTPIDKRYFLDLLLNA